MNETKSKDGKYLAAPGAMSIECGHYGGLDYVLPQAVKMPMLVTALSQQHMPLLLPLSQERQSGRGVLTVNDFHQLQGLSSRQR